MLEKNNNSKVSYLYTKEELDYLKYQTASTSYDEGRIDTKYLIAENLLNNYNLDLEQIADITYLTKEEVKKIAKNFYEQKKYFILTKTKYLSKTI